LNAIKVVIVDDSAFMRKVIGDLLEGDPEIKVIGKGRNGKEAVQLVEKLQPDVVTLDIEMPVMNGLEALGAIMENHPVPVLMLSSLTKQGASETIRALEIGAVDFISKPSGSISLDIHKIGSDIIAKVKAASRVNISRLRSSPESSNALRLVHQGSMSAARSMVDKAKTKADVEMPTIRTYEARKGSGGFSHEKTGNLIAIGTSTGGPKALQVVLREIPGNFDGTIAVVQHMPPGFTRSLAQRLDSLCEIRVVEAEDNQVLEKGTAYIAPGNYHMEIKEKADGQLYVSLNQSEPRGGHRPSVDTLFESVAKLKQPSKYAVIMTGMGSDGTYGLRRLKETGVQSIIAEDESTCVVFGMPRAAIQSGVVDYIAPLYDIAKLLVRCLNR
jgi:two-component system, chemotaxis family, protein-glutamate methylesterase/glutaminase